MLTEIETHLRLHNMLSRTICELRQSFLYYVAGFIRRVGYKEQFILRKKVDNNRSQYFVLVSNTVGPTLIPKQCLGITAPCPSN